MLCVTLGFGLIDVQAYCICHTKNSETSHSAMHTSIKLLLTRRKMVFTMIIEKRVVVIFLILFGNL